MSSTQNHRTYNVTATYPDIEHARRGVEILEEAGVEATTIFLAGRAAREAATEDDTAQRDRAWLTFTRNIARRGMLRGLIIGAVVGLVLGLIALRDNPVAVATMTGGIALVGMFLGFFVGLLSREKISGAFEETFEDVEGAVVVGVHTDDQSMFETATAALAGTHPEQLDRVDGAGNALPDADGRSDH